MNVEVIWEILFTTDSGVWNLGLLSSCRIEKSAKNLASRAIITLPEANFNKVLKLQDTISRGDEVQIKLGYKDLIWETEFKGFVKEIITNDSSLTVECEDALFLYRKSVPDKQFKPATITDIAAYLIHNINPNYELDCDYDISYEKFTIHQATAFDVLKKIQEETGADIYFEDEVLHIHPAYTRKSGEVDYSPQANIEKFSLEYKTAEDKKVEITVESTALDGTVTSYTTGAPDGEKTTKKVGRMKQQSIKLIADNEYRNRMTDGYEGSFDTWLIPFVEPSFTAGIYDSDYPYKDGRYYVDAVTTEFSASGITRTVQLGIKLSA
jgi:hypothetical protein